METYKLEIKKEEFLGMLSEYFTLKLEKPIRVREEHKATTNFRGDDEVYVQIYYEETIQILGHTATKTKVLSKEEIKEILNELINNKEYYIENLYYNTPMVWEGYGIGEHQEATFNGVTLEIKEKQKKLRK